MLINFLLTLLAVGSSYQIRKAKTVMNQQESELDNQNIASYVPFTVLKRKEIEKKAEESLGSFSSNPNKKTLRVILYPLNKGKTLQKYFDLFENDLSDIEFLPNAPTTFMAHGYVPIFGDHSAGCDQFLKKYSNLAYQAENGARATRGPKPGGVHQFVCIYWGAFSSDESIISGASTNFPYEMEAKKAIDVGTWLGEKLISSGVIKKHIKPENMHFIGHSLGAHLLANAARFLKKSTPSYVVDRLTGLDPAGPEFINQPALQNLRIKFGDAAFVDLIHSNGGMSGGNFVNIPSTTHFGDLHPRGDLDFYVNGGAYQKVCDNSREDIPNQSPAACSHNMAKEYYIKSILHSKFFPAKKADRSARRYSNIVTNYMGEYAQRPEKGKQQSFYVPTSLPCVLACPTKTSTGSNIVEGGLHALMPPFSEPILKALGLPNLIPHIG